MKNAYKMIGKKPWKYDAKCLQCEHDCAKNPSSRACGDYVNGQCATLMSTKASYAECQKSCQKSCKAHKSSSITGCVV